ncbi:hypothetical protein C0039_15880 [Pseudohalioglobus lutimaris]|uniref:HupE/UreJ family protein n=2 Tax=Pseudohalioglobus lutimaris TaxID=1737061 RepID=A0A2N5WZM9_9GAMM|nr:hypothetical protein C0039_15880 [Pseudohalioglobus lutimaris]
MPLVFALLLAPAASAHDTGVASIVLQENAPNQFLLQVKLPENIEPEPPGVPASCQVTAGGSRTLPSRNRLDIWALSCMGPVAAGEGIDFPWRREAVAVQATLLDGSERTFFINISERGSKLTFDEMRETARPMWQTLEDYFTLGVEHILSGWDHLAFVLALCLIASGRHLVALVTAFTVGHSLTLALAVIGWVNVPIPAVEACIALSIAFVAREVLRPSPGKNRGVPIALLFGLLHGLGFASALNEIGFRQGELLAGLVAFNIGVEAGQLLFVCLVLALALLVRPLAFPLQARAATACLLGALGMFWTIERVASFAV